MKCHYEVLQLTQSADDDDIRKAYRKLALKWHPDKNLNNSEEAKNQFQLIQQAYEILSDPQERTWYDRHRDSILKGGIGSDYKDDSLNVYQYFTTTCFRGFGDDENGFYSVYAEVFKKIAAEDVEFEANVDSDFEVPIFGNSLSSYEEIVHPFYSSWQSYYTKKSYSWLDKFDIRNAPSRRVLRLMEKENKKIRDKARKERNEEVRALVAFVRKRDKRVEVHTLYLEKKALENDKKMKDLKQKQLKKRREEISSYVECDWAKFSNLEGELKEIEANLAEEFKDLKPESNDSCSEEEGNNLPHCLACNKVFKTDKAFMNHEKSKKHKENLIFLEAVLKEEDIAMNNLVQNTDLLDDRISISNSCSDEDKKKSLSCEITKARKKKKGKSFNFALENNSDISDDEVYVRPKNISESSEERVWKVNKGKNRKKKSLKNSLVEPVKNIACDLNNQEEIKCIVCSTFFTSKNHLFKHLRSSGHSVPIIDTTNQTKSLNPKKKK